MNAIFHVSPNLASLFSSFSNSSKFHSSRGPLSLLSLTSRIMSGREVVFATKCKENKIRGGRFQVTVTDTVKRFVESISFDKAFYKHDIKGSWVHASMLAKQGVPFRTSHGMVGSLVALCITKSFPLKELNLDELRSINPVFNTDVYEFLEVENAVDKLCSYGKTDQDVLPINSATGLQNWKSVQSLNI